MVANVLSIPRSPGIAGQLLRFGGHFLEMTIAMEVGMMALGPVVSVLGLSGAVNSSPEASAFAMTASMVLPMAGWMLLRRHGWQHAAEMSVAMSVPTLLLIGASAIGLLPHDAASIGINYLMWLGMLAAMLFRWSSYAQGHHHGGHAG